MQENGVTQEARDTGRTGILSIIPPRPLQTAAVRPSEHYSGDLVRPIDAWKYGGSTSSEAVKEAQQDLRSLNDRNANLNT
jgi:hypothetical protein